MIHLCWHNSKCHFNCGNQRYIKIRCAWGKDFERLIPEWWRDELKHKIKQCQICLQALVAGQLRVSAFQKVVYNYYCISKQNIAYVPCLECKNCKTPTTHIILSEMQDGGGGGLIWLTCIGCSSCVQHPFLHIRARSSHFTNCTVRHGHLDWKNFERFIFLNWPRPTKHTKLRDGLHAMISLPRCI